MNVSHRASLALVGVFLLSCMTGHAQTPAPRAQVGPLQAWVARDASGVCQLTLHNVAEIAVVAWVVTVHSEEARYISSFRYDGWRDPFHGATASLAVAPGGTQIFHVGEDGALGDLAVRIHLLVLDTDVAHGMPEYAAHTGGAAAELRSLQDRRRTLAAEALALAEKIDAAIARLGMVSVLASRLASSALENEGDWNWWRVAEAAKAAEALPPASLQAATGLSAALNLLREAHRRGTAPVTLHLADPMSPLAMGSCSR